MQPIFAIPGTGKSRKCRHSLCGVQALDDVGRMLIGDFGQCTATTIISPHCRAHLDLARRGQFRSRGRRLTGIIILSN